VAEHRITAFADEASAYARFDELGWTDGLPIVAPTPERVRACYAFADVPADDVVGKVPKRNIVVTAEDVAINAVLAGCSPEQFPVVLAGVRAVCDEAFNVHSASASTSGAAICLIASGPLAAVAGLSARRSLLGGGNRANMCIGRAVRLVVRNVLGSRNGSMDASCLANPAKLSFCFAEDDPPDPWLPLRVELGYAREDTIVFALATEASRQIANINRRDPESLIRTFASAMGTPFTYAVGKHMQGILVIGPDHVRSLLAGGVSRTALRAELAVRSEIAPGALEAAGIEIEYGTQHAVDPTPRGTLATFAEPNDLFIVTAGTPGLGFSAYIPAIAAKLHFKATTSLVDPAPYARAAAGAQ
jgi:hypothetical protein